MIGKIQKVELTSANDQWHGYVEMNVVISARTLREKINVANAERSRDKIGKKPVSKKKKTNDDDW